MKSADMKHLLTFLAAQLLTPLTAPHVGRDLPAVPRFGKLYGIFSNAWKKRWAGFQSLELMQQTQTRGTT